MSFIVKVNGSQLFVEAPGQDKFEVFPEAEDKLFVKVAPAQVTFEKDENGQIAKMNLHHGGRAMPAKKIN
ncbi:hypothetical protein ABID22_001196 [Pontibacter aydingkolensis]|nr:DUF3471 domain-containing protein [Pontibacter aydingkolensis]